MLRLHKWKLLAIGLGLNASVLMTLALGETKLWEQIDWLDIVGEGGVSLLAGVWLFFTLASRPTGPVTSLLSVGLALVMLGSFQDFLDEIIALPEGSFWRGGPESILMPAGLVVLTLGLYHWHKEQLTLTRQRQKREQNFREYRLQDDLTGLGDARFLRQQLERHLVTAREQHQPLALVLIDVDHFDHTNRRFGQREGDRLLRELAELILLNMRRCDLLCRYAGDRFALVLPNTGELLAQELASQLACAIEHFAFKTAAQGETVYHTASAGIAIDAGTDAADLIARATRELLAAKDRKGRATHAA